MQPNEDLRVTKTKRALATALFSLLERQSFQKITVADICQEALVGRSTFYVHFEDKYMLLRHCLRVFKEQMTRQLQGGELYDLLLNSLNQLKERHRVLLNLLGADQNKELLSMMEEHLMGDFVTLLEQRRQEGEEYAIPLALVAVFYAGGIASMNLAWMRSGFSIPAEELAQGQLQLLRGVAQGVQRE